ncbi:hypothetical protein [Shinella sp.]|uniref:hypothetical protein n=1 Tax=Shinella sp. TaxID=1870904 RepID=UPI0029A35ADE|nr:hypothetical protein [Shinella sp.]MDX3975766.1 hypothetical protein [Shinella sp.]
MIARFAAALAATTRFFTQLGKDALSGLPNAGRWFEDIVSYPFRLIFGGGNPLPHYEPTVTKPDVIEEFKQARRAAATLHTIDPSGIESVRKFCNANQMARDGMDLSAIQDDARVLLLTMGDDELAALGKAGPGQIRKFVAGMQHGIHGVPVVGVHSPVPANDRSPRNSLDHRCWKIQAILRREIENRFKLE